MLARMKKRVVAGFTLIELMVVVAIIGILAAVAIPQFMKNARKAKTAEATTNVKKLYDGARAYYEEEVQGRGIAGATPTPKQFPTSNTNTNVPVPSMGTCCTGTGKGKCAPNTALWADPTWQALKFAMDDPHYFSYSYIAVNTATTKEFTARANGDLNCDGSVYSTFEMAGSVNSDGAVTGTAGLFKDKELE